MFTAHSDLTIEVSRFLLAALAVAFFCGTITEGCETVAICVLQYKYIISISIVEGERESERN